MESWRNPSIHSSFQSRTPFSETLDALVRIVENPFAEKVYIDLKKTYDDLGMVAESDAIAHLIGERFHANDVHTLP